MNTVRPIIFKYETEWNEGDVEVVALVKEDEDILSTIIDVLDNKKTEFDIYKLGNQIDGTTWNVLIGDLNLNDGIRCSMWRSEGRIQVLPPMEIR